MEKEQNQNFEDKSSEKPELEEQASDNKETSSEPTKKKS